MNMQPQKDFSPLLNSDIPLYMQVYTYYKTLITSGKLAPNAKLPSIRSCSATLSVSRTTAEAAYFQLCADGYIVSKPQSGYYVTDLYFRPYGKKQSAPTQKHSRFAMIFPRFQPTAKALILNCGGDM